MCLVCVCVAGCWEHCGKVLRARGVSSQTQRQPMSHIHQVSWGGNWQADSLSDLVCTFNVLSLHFTMCHGPKGVMSVEMDIWHINIQNLRIYIYIYIFFRYILFTHYFEKLSHFTFCSLTSSSLEILHRLSIKDGQTGTLLLTRSWWDEWASSAGTVELDLQTVSNDIWGQRWHILSPQKVVLAQMLAKSQCF